MEPLRENPFTIWTFAGGLVVGTLGAFAILAAIDPHGIRTFPTEYVVTSCVGCVTGYVGLAWLLRHTWIGFVLRIPGYLMELGSIIP